MTTSNPYDPGDPHERADDADLAEQRTPVGDDDEIVEVPGRDEVDEGDLLEQATPVPDDDDEYQE